VTVTNEGTTKADFASMDKTTTDEAIESILKYTFSEIIENNISTDWRGDYFSNNLLDDVRKVYEKNGYQSAKVYVTGKIKAHGNKWENKKCEIILGLLKKLHETSNVDVPTKAYIIGKLNSILTVHNQGGKKQ
jgi:hypothetical protein